MEKNIELIGKFFDDYAKTFNTSLQSGNVDIEGTTVAFADYFVGANPHAVMGGPNDEAFRRSLMEGYAFYRRIGVTATPLVAKEITMLDTFHAMAKIRWRCEFRRKDGTGGSVEFDNIYFVHIHGGAPEIFAWITGDEQQTLKDIRLIE